MDQYELITPLCQAPAFLLHCHKNAYYSAYFVSVLLISGGGTGDTLPLSLDVTLVVSLTALVAFVVLLVNCVTCCKEREINFKVGVPAQHSEEATSDKLKLHQAVLLS